MSFVDGDSLDNTLKVLVVRCLKSKALFVHPVPKKGLDDKGYVIDCLVKDILWLGYSRLLVKCDTEPSTMAFDHGRIKRDTGGP